ncbi:MAG: hypothetical protein IPO32_07735 [Crocinitomicaceae bacterium]|nr:hypothetical protein [Crocinitomicaceae bacterium]
MKVQTNPLLNFVMEELEKIGALLNQELPAIANRATQLGDLFYSYWSVFYCGGDCAESCDNFKSSSLVPYFLFQVLIVF